MGQYLNKQGLARVWAKIKATFQAKELKTGSETEYKVLSDNNLTDELVAKIGSSITKDVADLANYTKTEDLSKVALSNDYNDLDNLPTIPTDNAELANGAGYQTASDVNTAITEAVKDFATDTEVADAIAEATKDFQTADDVATAIGEALKDVTSISYEVVTELPAVGEAGVIYLIANEGENPNIYDEYIYTNDKFEKIGTTETDLSGYMETSAVITDEEIDAILV